MIRISLSHITLLLALVHPIRKVRPPHLKTEIEIEPNDLHKKNGHLKGGRRYKVLLVRPAGFEPAAYGFVVRRSIRAELRAHDM